MISKQPKSIQGAGIVTLGYNKNETCGVKSSYPETNFFSLADTRKLKQD
jgi:hypothetical protein